MEWLKIAALTMALSDGLYTCKQINSGAGYEANKLMPKTCQGILLRKGALLVPMYVVKNKKWQKVFVFSNLASGSIGLSVSVYNMNKD
jgi:hypothetical protein